MHPPTEAIGISLQTSQHLTALLFSVFIKKGLRQFLQVFLQILVLRILRLYSENVF